MRSFVRVGRVWAGGMAAVVVVGCGEVQHAPDAGGGQVDSAPMPDAPAPDIDSAPPDAALLADWFVDAASGDDDAHDGAAPDRAFRTITRALSVAAKGDEVQLAAGTYDAAHGETFPIAVPDGVVLRGDESTKGAGVIVAGGSPEGFIGTVIAAGAGSTVAGLTIQAVESGATNTMGLHIVVSNVTIQNCTIADGLDTAIYIREDMSSVPTTGHVIRGNVLVRNNLGIGFIGGGDQSLVEDNLIRENAFGVEYDTVGGDLGGGNTGSAGGNIIACNTTNDLWTNQAPTVTISAAGCAWDHSPPSGNDISNGGGAIINLGDATVALDPCL